MPNQILKMKKVKPALLLFALINLFSIQLLAKKEIQ